jgi:hypothetical protein
LKVIVQELRPTGCDPRFCVDATSSGHTGLPNPFVRQTLPATDAQNTAAIINTIRTNFAAAPKPEWLTSIQVVSSLPSTRVNGRLYVVQSSGGQLLDVTLSGTNLTSFGVLANKIIISSGSSGAPRHLRQMYLAANDMIDGGSDLRFGNSTYCQDGTGAVFIVARNQFKVASNIGLFGTQIIAGQSGGTDPSVEFGSNIKMSGMAVQAARDIKGGSNVNFAYCGRTDHVLYNAGTALLLPPVLVQ